MKVMIVSDTHGCRENLEIALKQIGPLDLFIHMGDVEGGLKYIEELVTCEKHFVAGNNDYFLSFPRELEFFIGPYKTFITHGHQFSVSLGVEHLRDEGISRGDNIMMFGHTHRPYLEIGEEITILNPGSISYPRQPGRQSSFMTMELDRENNITYRTYYLQENGVYEELEK